MTACSLHALHHPHPKTDNQTHAEATIKAVMADIAELLQIVKLDIKTFTHMVRAHCTCHNTSIAFVLRANNMPDAQL